MLKRLAVASLLIVLLPLQARALETEDLLALVAMPLAVAAVSEMSEVPQDQLFDVVALLNEAAVPPAQFIEVVRYAPVALVTPVPQQPSFVEFVRTQEQRGVVGTRLVTVIEDRYRLVGVPVELTVAAPRVVELDSDEFIPQIVRTRIAEVKTHPHGGPPGQLKKIVHRDLVRTKERVIVAESRQGHGHSGKVAKGKSKGKGKG